jgi:hypothetical protein
LHSNPLTGKGIRAYGELAVCPLKSRRDIRLMRGETEIWASEEESWMMESLMAMMGLKMMEGKKIWG